MLSRILFFSSLLALGARADDLVHTELRRFPAAEATQGVAVDGTHFYAVANRAIGKYRKDTGKRVALWRDEKGGRFRHLNAGIVIEGRLYCAHSNFPTIPEESSVEIWDVATLEHVESLPFPDPPGSLTWVDRRGEAWYACFAHYRSSGDPARSRVVRYDAAWRPQARWSFPPSLIERFAGSSASGGAFGPGGLFVSGHDARELYLLELPAEEGELRWIGTVPMSAAGQAFAWDRSPGNEGVLYAIERKTREVIVSRVAKQ